VVTDKKWVHVTDIGQLYRILDTAVAETLRPAPPRRAKVRNP
jgi:hypothetical protein